MLFRAPGKPGNFEYSNASQYQPMNQMNQRSAFSYNNSFTVGQKCASQEKGGRNYDQRFFNFQAPTLTIKTEPQTPFEDSRYRQMPFVKTPSYTDMPRTPINIQNNSSAQFEQQCLILRKQKSQFSQKMKRVEEQLQAKENLIRGKQRQIEQLKLQQSQSFTTKPSQGDILSELKAEKQRLYFQVIQLQAELHKMQQKYEKMQREHYSLSYKFDELSNKSSQEQNRKAKREQLLQSQLSLAQKRFQRQKTEYQRQVNCLKQRIKQLEDESMKNYSNKSAVISYNNGSFLDQFASTKSQSDSEFSKTQIEKLQGQIRQKNEMIKYLEVQCLKQVRKRESSGLQSEISKINGLYQESRKQLETSSQQNDSLKKENSFLTSKLAKSQKMAQELKKQVKNMEFLINQVRANQLKSTDQKRTINKRQQENMEKYENKIRDLQAEIKKITTNSRLQQQNVQKKYEKLMFQIRQRHDNQILTKNQMLKQYSIDKQKVMQKISEYQGLLKKKQQQVERILQQKNKIKISQQERSLIQQKISDDMSTTISILEKKLKLKSQELFLAQSNKITLEKQIYLAKKTLEERVVQFEKSINKLQEQKRKFEAEKKYLELQLSKTKITYEDKLLLIKNETSDKSQKQMQQRINSTIRKVEDRYESIIKNMKDQERKLRNLIGDYEKNNLNLTIDAQNQKRKRKQAENMLLKLEQEKLDKKKQIQSLNNSIKELNSKLVPLSEELQQTKKMKSQLIVKYNESKDKNDQLLLRLQSQLAQQRTKCEISLKQKQQYMKNLKSAQAEISNKQVTIAQLKGLTEQLQGKDKQINYLKSVHIQLKQKQKIIEKLKLKQIELAQKQKIIIDQQKELRKINLELQKMVTTTQQSNNDQLKIEQLNQKLQELSQQIKQKQELLSQKDKSIAENEAKIQNLQLQLLQKQSLEEKIKNLQIQFDRYENLEEQIKQLQAQSQEKEQLQNKVSELKAELQFKQSIAEQLSNCQSKLIMYETENISQIEEIKALRNIIKQRQSTQFQHRKSLTEKDKYNKQIQSQLQELTNQLLQIKIRLQQAQMTKVKVLSPAAEEEQRNLKMSKMSGMSSQSFIVDYIEIDKNALLHICDLLDVQPIQGQILKTIIDTIQFNPQLRIQQSYRQILELFGVQSQINEGTQEILISQIKNFRQTISTLIQKASLLENRNQNLLKDNHRLVKQIGKMEAKQIRMFCIEHMMDELSEEIMKSKARALNNNYKLVEEKDEEKYEQLKA